LSAGSTAGYRNDRVLSRAGYRHPSVKALRGASPPQFSIEARVAAAAYGILAVGAGAWWMWLGRGTTFFYDEWNFVLAYRVGLWTAMTTPHVGQFVAVPVLVYRAMFAVVGLAHYWPYRLVGTGFELAMTTVSFAYLQRRIRPLFALMATIAVMGAGQGWQDILWPFELTFTISLATGVAVLIFLDRRGALADACAAACLVVSVASSGFGLVFIAGTAAETTWTALTALYPRAQDRTVLTRRAAWQSLGRAWVVTPALGLYLAWYVHGHVGDAVLSRVHEVPAYVAQSAGYGVASLLGLHSVLPGEVLAAVIAAALLTRLITDWRSAPRLAMTATAALTFWVLDGLARGEGAAASSRYLQPDALLVVLALAEIGTSPKTVAVLGDLGVKWQSWLLGVLVDRSHRGYTRSRRRRARPYELALTSGSTALVTTLGVITILAVASNSGSLVSGSHALQAMSAVVKADLRAVELAGNRLPADFQPVPTYAPQIVVRGYLSAERALGSPADTGTQLLVAPEDARTSADSLLIDAMQPSQTRQPPTQATDRPPTGKASCLPGTAAATAHNGGTLQLDFGKSGVLVAAPKTAPVTVGLRLFATEFSVQPDLTVPPATTALIAARHFITPHTTTQWLVQLTVEGHGRAVACIPVRLPRQQPTPVDKRGGAHA